MALVAPELPNSFPCWVQAVFSWGGENPTDLGFVEGELIECLNAGDGSWWTGRLRRDRRTVGMFPSNFVKVLPEDFSPPSRRPSRSSSPNPQTIVKKPESKPFRKPFQAYAAPDPALQTRSERRRQETRDPSPSPGPRSERTRRQAPKGYRASRATSPTPINLPRAHSPNPYNVPRARSPNPYLSREPTYSQSIRAESPSGSPSDDADGEYGSPPPPPPPPHRTDFRAQTSTGFHEHRNEFTSGFHRPRSLTPDPPTPESRRTGGHTPSPLTHAMNDVISSLEDMGTEQVPDPWSPEAYELPSGYTPRPKTSTGIDHEYDRSENRPNHRRTRTEFSEEPPQLSNYVERMESRLGRSRQKDISRMSDERSDPQIVPDIPPEVPPKGKGSFFRPKSPFGRPKSPFGRPKSPFDRPKSPSVRPKSPFGRPKSPFGSWGRPKSPFAGSESPPPLPPINPPRSKSSMGNRDGLPILRHRKSAYEVGKQFITRNFTGKSTSTNQSSGVQSNSTNTTSSTNATSTTDKSLMSGQSAGAYSATSAGSYARKQAEKYGRAQSAMGTRKDDFDGSRPETPFTGITYHSSHASDYPPRSQSQAGWRGGAQDSPGMGSVTPKAKKSGFFKRMVESAKTGAASARSTISVGSGSPQKDKPPGVHGFGNFGTQYLTERDAARDSSGMGTDWVRVRQDVNRSNSLSRFELTERKQRSQIHGFPAIDPIDELHDSVQGDEGGDGRPVLEPTNFQSAPFILVDKNARFIDSLPPMSNAMSLTLGFVCRPYKSDLQRLRAIFTWCAEKIIWEEEYEGADVDTERVVQKRRGATEEIVFLVLEMCQAVNISCNVIRGYLKTPGEIIPHGRIPHPNHFWNSVLIDNEWRIMDCSLASPTHPKRSLYSNASSQVAESWYFLTRPSEICYTHVPVHHEDQHLVPRVLPDILLALPCACPPYFKNDIQIVDYNTSILRIHDLEMVHIKLNVPATVECTAEVEALALGQDMDGDSYETGEVKRMKACAQALWFNGQKQYKVKAILPAGTASQGVLKVYAGPRGLMSGSKTNPHPMVFALPIMHTGESPEFEFFGRYPTPHANRHDLYVIQPQCKRLVVGNTFVFAIRQHPSSLSPDEVLNDIPEPGRDGGRSPIPGLGSRDGNRSPLPLIRPNSALSMTSSSAQGSNPLNEKSTHLIENCGEGVRKAHHKSAKLAIQAPGGKILRFQKKEDRAGSAGGVPRGDGTTDIGPDGRVFETIIKCGEKGIWRGLVLADKSAKWCVFAEWICV